MNAEIPPDPRLMARIEGEATELRGLRSALYGWLVSADIGDESRHDLVLAAHELAAEAIERGAAEVAVLGEVIGDAIRLTVAGGEWASLDEMRSTLVLALAPQIRLHRGIVTIRLTLAASRAETAKGGHASAAAFRVRPS